MEPSVFLNLNMTDKISRRFLGRWRPVVARRQKMNFRLARRSVGASVTPNSVREASARRRVWVAGGAPVVGRWADPRAGSDNNERFPGTTR